MEDIESLYSDKLAHELDVLKDKVLCIVEGKDELSFVKKVYELNHTSINCEAFLTDKIELSWGKEPIFWRNIKKCNFQGGNLSECPVPMPVLESLNAHDLETYEAIFVMFDGDCDTNNFLKSNSETLLSAYNHYIFISDICFEKVAMEFVQNSETKEYISQNYKIIEDSLCKWYKNSYGAIPKSNYFRRVQSLERVIDILRLEDIEKEELLLNRAILFLKSNI